MGEILKPFRYLLEARQVVCTFQYRAPVRYLDLVYNGLHGTLPLLKGAWSGELGEGGKRILAVIVPTPRPSASLASVDKKRYADEDPDIFIETVWHGLTDVEVHNADGVGLVATIGRWGVASLAFLGSRKNLHFGGQIYAEYNFEISGFSIDFNMQ